MPPNDGRRDVTGCKFSSQGSDGAKKNAKTKTQRLADELDRNRHIYAFQGALDGLNLSYTTLKYFFDALNPDATLSASDTMHTWMLTPVGIAAAALESVFLVVFSMLANYLKDTNDYQLCVMKPDITIKKNKLYVQIAETGSIRYTVKTPSGTLLSAVIKPEDLGLDSEITKHLTLQQLQPHLSKILAITLKRGHTEKPQPIFFNKYLAIIWPYFREALKGLKNSYKGTSSVLTALNFLGVLGVENLNLLIVPVAVALGGITVLNRMWYRRMKNQRKENQEINAKLHKDILAHKKMTEEDAAAFRLRMRQAQNSQERRKSFASAAIAGFTDGLYLYMGVFTLAALTGPFFLAVCAISATYVLTAVITRLYEEYDYQNKLKASQVKVELDLAMQLLKVQLQQLDALLANPDSSDSSDDEQERILRANIAKNWDHFTKNHRELKSLSTIFNGAALLGGLKNGLVAYGVLASVLFAVGAILILASVAFPPALLMTFVFIGVACLIGFTLHSVVMSYRYRKEQRQLCQSVEDLLKQSNEKVEKLVKVDRKKKTEEPDLQRALVNAVLETVEDKDKRLVVKASPQYTFEAWVGKWMEIFRSFFAGIKQAAKSEDFTVGSFCRDTLVTIIVTALGGFISAVSGALRALAKNFGHNDNDVADHSAPVSSIPPPPSPFAEETPTPPSSPASELVLQRSPSTDVLPVPVSLPSSSGSPFVRPRVVRPVQFFESVNVPRGDGVKSNSDNPVLLSVAVKEDTRSSRQAVAEKVSTDLVSRVMGSSASVVKVSSRQAVAEKVSKDLVSSVMRSSVSNLSIFNRKTLKTAVEVVYARP